MKIVTLIARILMGLMFVVFGLNFFFHFIPTPTPTGLVAQYLGVLYPTHYLVLAFVIQIVAGVLLIVGRYVPLALTLLAPVLVHILLFHTFIAHSGLPMPLFVVILWFIVFASVRHSFDGIFAAKA